MEGVLNYTWEFDKQKPVAQFTFEELLAYMTPHIRGYSFRSVTNYVPYTQEDLQQECNLVLWKCYQKYQHFSNLEFIKLFKTSMANRIADIMRLRESSRSEPETSLDDIGQIADLAAKNNVIDSTFYDREIASLAEQLNPDLRSRIMRACQPDIKGRRNRLEPEQEIKLKEKMFNGN